MQLTTFRLREVGAAKSMPLPANAFRTNGTWRHTTDLTTDDIADHTCALLLELLGDLGRAAAIIRHDGRVIHFNREVEILKGDMFVIAGQRLRATRPDSQKALEVAIERAFAGTGMIQPLALRRSHTVAPLLVRIIPLERMVLGGKAALALFTDLETDHRENAINMLRLIGLTSGQARIAVLVGGGQSPKEAAAALNIAPNTVRSTLKSIYGKLGLSRQSELAQLVARMETS